MIKINAYQLRRFDESMQKEFVLLACDGWPEFHQENLKQYPMLDESELASMASTAWQIAKNFESEQWDAIFQATYYMAQARTIGYDLDFVHEVGSFFLNTDPEIAEAWVATFFELHTNPPSEWLS
jgi:hypothetical protein